MFWTYKKAYIFLQSFLFKWADFFGSNFHSFGRGYFLSFKIAYYLFIRQFSILIFNSIELFPVIPFRIWIAYIGTHSMARANLNKSKKVLTSITTASKYTPKRPRICINWNPPFQTTLHKFFKNCFYEVNLVSQYSHL